MVKIWLSALHTKFLTCHLLDLLCIYSGCVLGGVSEVVLLIALVMAEKKKKKKK
jgi:hypothetical protein